MFQPDLVVASQTSQISSRGIEGPPLLIAEILSASTCDQDRHLQVRRYRQLGVLHYWIVDPEIPRLECYRAESGQYTLRAEGEGVADVSHPDFPDLGIRLQDLTR